MVQLAPVESPQYDDSWSISGRKFRSRLLLGTGKYSDVTQAAAAIRAGGAEIVTAAIRRVSLGEKAASLLDVLSPEQYTYLPNTAGCTTAEEALRTAKLAQAMGGWDLIKLEIIGDKSSLLPNMHETEKATELLVKNGFDVMAYMQDDPIAATRIEAAGAAALMPLAAPIGTGRGIERPENIKQIIRNATVPVIVDAGIGTPSDAAHAMELGCDAVLMNTAIAQAKDPVAMARAMKLAVESGRIAHYAGCMTPRNVAQASSPTEGYVE